MRKNLIVLFAALLLSGLTESAQAASLPYTVDLLGTASPVVGTLVDLSSLNDGPYHGTTTYTLPGAIFTPTNAEINSFKSNRNSISGLTVGEKYLSVVTSPDHPNAYFSFTLSQPAKTIGFIWGSFDETNILTVTNKSGTVSTITGEDIEAALQASNASFREGKTSVYFTFSDIAGIVSIALQSTSNKFEMARLTLAQVPLPAALPLFGTALVGLAAVRRRKNAAKA